MLVPCRLSPLTLGLSLLFSASLASAAATTLPESSVTADSEREKDNPRVKEVSTATRTSTPVRYVPQAIDTVKTSNVLDYGSNTLGKALEGIPNVSSGADTRFDSVRIRGFEASNDFYLDGIRDDSQYIRDLHNIERVEVLKGLQRYCMAVAARAASSTGSARHRSRVAARPSKRRPAAKTCAACMPTSAQTPATRSACA